MLLTVVNKGDFCFKVLSATLVSKLPNVSTRLASLPLVPCFDDLGALAKRAKATPAGNERRILVCEETSNESCATVRIFGRRGYAMEGLCVVALHASVADACARRKYKFVFCITVRELVVGKVIRAIRDDTHIDGLIHVLVDIFPFTVVARRFLCGRVGWIRRCEIVIV